MKEGDPLPPAARESGAREPELLRPRFKLGQVVSTPGAVVHKTVGFLPPRAPDERSPRFTLTMGQETW